MRKLTPRELGGFRLEMMSLLARSPDPFSSVLYRVDAGPSRQRAKALGPAGSRRITLAPVVIKLIAHAIAAHPVYNQLILGRNVYQMEEIHIANIVMETETGALTYVIIANPHQKSLQDIQQELLAGMTAARERAAAREPGFLALLTRLSYRYCLYRIIGQKLTFSLAFERGLLSNISLANHFYSSEANFTMLKDVVTPINISPKFHACGPVKKAIFENGMLVTKDIIELHVTTDHRIVNGFHCHQFGETLQRLAAHPEQYIS